MIKNLVFKGATKVTKKSVKFHSDWNVLSFFSVCPRIATRNPKYCRDVSGLLSNHSKLHGVLMRLFFSELP